MRLIKSFDQENTAKGFSLYLQEKGIENTVEVALDDATKKFSYQVWVHDEDLLLHAKKYLEEFEKNPQKKLDIAIQEEEKDLEEMEEPQEKKSRFSFTLTAFFLMLCIFIYFINTTQEIEIRKKNPKLTYVLLTPIQYAFLYDVPYVLIQVDKIIKKYQFDPTKEIQTQSETAQRELEAIDKMPFWRGFYEMILLKNKKGFQVKGKLFEKIREGQIWRLFTPCILHKGLLHLLFNMLWLWLLGKQIEQRIKMFRYLLFILIVGIISNTAQYLMSGPYFLGYSGVVMGMVGFIWSRQKVAPWEGYPLQKAVFLFLGIYVILMFVLSFFSFVTQILGMNLFTPNIANTAHIVGALVGWALGRMSFFSWRLDER